jgi:hypothetical protein
LRSLDDDDDDLNLLEAEASPQVRRVGAFVRPWKKHWEIIADRPSTEGWSWGCSSHVDSTGCVFFTADAHRDDGKRVMVSADEKLTAFLALERVTRKDSA